MADSFADLQALSRDELLRRYDSIAQSTTLGLSFYRDEIARRESREATATMLALTKPMRNLTWVILVLTIANVLLVAFALGHQ